MWASARTYSTLLKTSGEDIKVVQGLMRHANILTTMNIYIKALTPAKRKAQTRVVDVLMTSSMPWKRAPSCATGPHLCGLQLFYCLRLGLIRQILVR